MALRAVIFDLDGVITDTAEYHFQAWKKMADDESIPFDRALNEQLRGVSRLESLLRILGDRPVAEERLQSLMARKNRTYQEMLDQVTPADLLPGVVRLLDELDDAGVPYAIASASRNARDVVRRLGIGERLAALADGASVPRMKPAPDLFRFAAAQLDQPPQSCLVVEDAAAGVAAALNAGMPALALGPAERFEELGPEPGRFAHRPNLEDMTLAELRTMVEPDLWHVVQEHFEPERQHHMETVFTTGNGYFASRGSFEEGYAGDHALTLAHGVFDDAPIVVTELVNLPNWLDLRLRLDGQPFAFDQGQILDFQRSLALRRGLLQRHVRWQAPNGLVVDLTFERFISYDQPHLAALRLMVTPVNGHALLQVETGIDGHVANEDLLHWEHLDQGHDAREEQDHILWLRSRTRHSGIEICAAATVTAAAEATFQVVDCPRFPALRMTAATSQGQTLLVDKIVAYTTSRDLTDRDETVVERARRQLSGAQYDELKRAHVDTWQRVWNDIDVLIEGDSEAQLAVRFNLFQLQIAAPRNDDRVSIGAKTLSGLGYCGHIFWDTEIFILPFFTYTQPEIARNLLCYRYHTLPGARRKAQANAYRGAQYAWESALTGDEVTPRWVLSFDGTSLVRIWTGDIEIHISADIAYAVVQYWRVSCDDAFMRDQGAEIVLDTARFWADRAEEEMVKGQRRFSYRDVIGPDEYHEHVDNNVYTNRMAQWHLNTAQEILNWLEDTAPEKAKELKQRLSLTAQELARWRDVARHIVIHHDGESGLMLQFEGFFDLEEVDWEEFEDRTQSMQFLLGIEGANRSQVIKQADVIMLLCLLRGQYDEKTWRANWDTYMPLTDHQYGSSLGPSFHAWAACEMGRPDEAYEHFMLAARADLRDVRGNAGHGIHAASAGGVWQAVAFGFAGLQLHQDGYEISPRLPSHWRRLRFKFRHCGEQQVVDVTQNEG